MNEEDFGKFKKILYIGYLALFFVGGALLAQQFHEVGNILNHNEDAIYCTETACTISNVAILQAIHDLMNISLFFFVGFPLVMIRHFKDNMVTRWCEVFGYGFMVLWVVV